MLLSIRLCILLEALETMTDRDVHPKTRRGFILSANRSDCAGDSS